MSDVIHYCRAFGRQLEVTFTLRGSPLTVEEIFNDRGLLPPLAKRADQLSALCLGYGIGVTFEKEEKSTTGERVLFDEATPMTVRMLCLMDVIMEIVAANASDIVALDGLLQDG